MPSVTIVGGGISGLVTAFDLHRTGWDVRVLEASDRFGGKIHSSPVGDRMVDAGPDTFLARVPHGRRLCADLGLADELVSPVAPVPAYVVRDGGLHPLPAGTMLGVPTDLDALAASGLVSADGVARAARDLDLPVTDLHDHRGVEITVGAYCRARLGDEVTDRLIDPLIGGINASDTAVLGLRSGAPQLWAAATEHRSIIEGMRARRAAVGATLGSAADEPVFLGLPGGIQRIIDRLVEELTGADLRLDAPVADLGSIDADHVVLATPAPVSARLLADAPATASHLAGIEYASVAQVTVELPIDAVDPVLDASGVLFPRVDGTVVTAATWFSTKWAHHARSDRVLVRLTSGRHNDRRALDLDDDQLVRTLLDELGGVVRVTAPPAAIRVHRWIDALPQYTAGHLDRIDAARAALADEAPHVHLVGAAYDGIGIPACIAAGRDLAAHLAAAPGSP